MVDFYTRGISDTEGGHTAGAWRSWELARPPGGLSCKHGFYKNSLVGTRTPWLERAWSLWAPTEAHAHTERCRSERGPGQAGSGSRQSQWPCGIRGCEGAQGHLEGTPNTLARCLEHPGNGRGGSLLPEALALCLMGGSSEGRGGRGGGAQWDVTANRHSAPGHTLT